MRAIIRNIKKLLLLMTVCVLTSCNQDFPNLLDKEYSNRPIGTQANKVLLVVVDGIRGDALNEIDPENLRVISRNSLYSNSSLGDFQNTPFTKNTGMANILTGVSSQKHGLTGDDLETVNLTDYPTFLSRLKETYEGFSAVTYTTDAQVNEHLFVAADTREVLADDEAVVAKTKDAILNQEVALIVSHLSNVDQVGATHSYESNDPAYRAAVLTFDEQINDIIETIKQRPDYLDENWLVIITSSAGGEIANPNPDDLTAYGDSKRNTFTYFYSPKFTRRYVVKPNSTDVPFEGNVIRYTSGSPAVNARAIDPSAFNFGSNQDFTISFFYKDMNTAALYYPIFLSKRVQGFSGAGWNMFIEGTSLGWNSSISGQLFTSTTPARDGNWHAITVVVNRSGERVALFVDGILQGSNTPNGNNLDNNSPLAIGRWPGNDNASAQFLLANLQIYNTAFTDQEVEDLAGIAQVDSDHPKHSNLVGYWPGYADVGTSVLTDQSGNNNHMNLTGPYTWTTFSDVVRYFKPDISASFYGLVPNQVDIPFFIYQWYGVLPSSSWSLDGQAWTPPFAILEY